MLSFTSVGGGEKYRKSWTHFVQDTNLVRFVVDSADKSRFQLASFELKKLLADDRLHGIPLIVVANKQVGADHLEQLTSSVCH